MEGIKRYALRNRYLILSSFIVILTISFSLLGLWKGDFWEHSSVIRELSNNPFSPSHPLFNIKAPHVFFSPYALCLALFSRIFSLSPITILSIFSIINISLLLIFFKKFIFELLKFDNSPFYSLLLILVLWGFSPWFYSGFYHLEVLPYVSPYPSTFSLSISFIILVLYIRFFNTFSFKNYIIILFLSEIVLLSHPITAIFLFVGLLAITINAECSFLLKYLLLIGIIGMSFFFAFIWPYFPFFDLFNCSEFDLYNRTMYNKVFIRTFPVFLGIPLIIQRIASNRKDILGLMFIGLCIIYVYGGISGKYTYGRVISFIIFIIDIVIAEWIAKKELYGNFNKKILFIKSKYFLIVLLSILFILHFKPVLKSMKNDVIGNKYKFLQHYIRNNDVILSDIKTSWYIPTFGAKIIASDHPVAFVKDWNYRRKDIINFFNNNTSDTARLSIIKKYDCNYILINLDVNKKLNINTLNSIYRMGEIVFSNHTFKLIKVSRELLPKG